MSTSKKQRIQAKKKVRYNLGGDGFGQSAEQKRRRFETNRTHRAPALGVAGTASGLTCWNLATSAQLA